MASQTDDNSEAHFQSATRAAPRLPLSLPGVFISTLGNLNCIVTNLSRTGVLIAIREPLRPKAQGYLRCGPIDHFVIVKRAGVGQNAMVFEIPVSDVFVAKVRQYQNQFEENELAEMRSTAENWSGLKAGVPS